MGLTLLMLAIAFAGCSAGVNEDLAATVTPRVRTGEESPPARRIVALPDTALATLLAEDPTARLARLDADVAAGDESAEIRATRGLLRFRLGDYAAARQDFEAALVADPGKVSAYIGRGLVAIATAQGNPNGYTAALHDFNRALTLDSDATTARLGRAWVFLDRATYRGDRADWETAISEAQDERLRDEPLAMLIVAAAYAGLGDAASARQALDGASDALKGDTGVRAAALMTVEARMAVSEGQHERALERAQAALAVDAYQWEARRIEAASLLALNRVEDGRDAASRLTADLPDDGRAWLLLATAQVNLGDRQAAVAALTRARELLTQAPAYSATILQLSEQLGVPASPSPTIR